MRKTPRFRPGPSRFPWYDSFWLSEFLRARELISAKYPEKLDSFVETFEPLRTRPDFETTLLKSFAEPGQIAEAREVAKAIEEEQLEKHEFFQMGRNIVHDHEFFSEMQKSLTGVASDLAGEALEPGYNFLSLYNNLGACALHLDSPQSKWTLDICLDQSDVWPIHFSKVVPWPEDFRPGKDWAEIVKAENDFEAIELESGDAAFFSGSSQWHYRNRIAKAGDRKRFCHLIFFHYVPEGTAPILSPFNWAERFGLPEFPRSDESNQA